MFPWLDLAGGLLGGMFGSSQPEPILPPQAEWAGKFLKRLAKRTLAESNSVPMSLPGELAGLAQEKGLAGEEFRNSYQNMLAALGTNQPGSDNSADALKNFGENQVGNLMNMDSQAMMQALQRRLAMRNQAAGYAQSAGGMGAGAPLYQQPTPDFSSLFQAIGQQLGQRGGRSAVAPSASFAPPSSSVTQRSMLSPQQKLPDYTGSEDWARYYGGSLG